MLLIFSSTLSKKSFQLQLFVEEMKRRGLPCVVVDVHDIATNTKFSIQHSNDGAFLFEDGQKIISPQKVYVMNVWRTDSIIRLPPDFDKPQLIRNRVSQFVNDIRFIFEDCMWVPGRIEDIERADSKMRLFKEAVSCGLNVPRFTIDSPHYDGKFGIPVYKKSLGYPFSISYSKQKKKEVAVITTNLLVDKESDSVGDGLLWQWQAPILSSKQIRCHVVGNKIWSVMWDRGVCGVEDYRHTSNIKNEVINWKPHSLPAEISSQILKLMKNLSVCMASPEFLVDKNGDYILIDLNPCGDWYGFFSKIQRKEILDSIIQLCC
ncbi:hypothetical protein A2442_01415 [Candidatus Campbellbacteria bacterium RIFOXYC2_FULL_35_25]|uniref:ATP-grasp domain-containing protein n=1 Tax=Candidatus Campbellbacteria bacterium RIFOXYC2_FULL_35_25 TaxID=1797582 RepID=A0A1F5EHS4_9BACT|nr:MAG: hypothetical protein A2442_01415 [Candidatus Campbellbacteria bacterium RIFOXYC2_FULL_35_25]